MVATTPAPARQARRHSRTAFPVGGPSTVLGRSSAVLGGRRRSSGAVVRVAPAGLHRSPVVARRWLEAGWNVGWRGPRLRPPAPHARPLRGAVLGPPHACPPPAPGRRADPPRGPHRTSQQPQSTPAAPTSPGVRTAHPSRPAHPPRPPALGSHAHASRPPPAVGHSTRIRRHWPTQMCRSVRSRIRPAHTPPAGGPRRGGRA